MDNIHFIVLHIIIHYFYPVSDDTENTMLCKNYQVKTFTTVFIKKGVVNKGRSQSCCTLPKHG